MAWTSDLEFPYIDYKDAGEPYGRSGYPRWVHEKFQAQLTALQAENEKLAEKVKACHKRIDDDTETINRQCKRIGELENVAHYVELIADDKPWSHDGAVYREVARAIRREFSNKK